MALPFSRGFAMTSPRLGPLLALGCLILLALANAWGQLAALRPLTFDGTPFAVLIADGTTRLLDAVTGREVPPWATGEPSILSPDGRRVAVVTAAGNQEATIQFWDTDAGRPMGTIAVVNPDQIQLWYVPTGAALDKLTIPGENIQFATFAPNGTTLAAATTRDVYLWDTAAPGPPRRLPRPDAPVTAPPAFSADGRFLAVGLDGPGGASGAALVYTLATGRPRRVAGHRAAVSAIALHPDGARLATGSRDTTILVWDLGR